MNKEKKTQSVRLKQQKIVSPYLWRLEEVLGQGDSMIKFW
jgi:hypothetical protein